MFSGLRSAIRSTESWLNGEIVPSNRSYTSAFGCRDFKGNIMNSPSKILVVSDLDFRVSVEKGLAGAKSPGELIGVGLPM